MKDKIMANNKHQIMEEIIPKGGHVHLIGIGGVGMSGLALLLKEKGYTVSGSDLKESYYLAKVRQAGVKVKIGHCRDNASGADLVCYSSAVKDDNPELVFARDQGIALIGRGSLLAALSRDKKVIAVSGSHGKTTTSALLTFLLSSCGYEPAAFIGAQPCNYEQAAWWGNDFFVIEADESDGSFLSYSPWVAIVTNIDKEHMDFYKTEQKLTEMFSCFFSSAQELAIAWGDLPQMRSLLRDRPFLTYGFEPHNQVRAGNVRVCGKYTLFDLRAGETLYRDIKIMLPGEHNVLNACAALSFFYHIKEDLNKVISFLAEFKSTKRRFQRKGSCRGIDFVDDYAHHPTEIKATLKAAAALNPERIVALFQPHRFSRVSALQQEFSLSFADADLLVLTDVYAASEVRPDDFDEEKFRKEIKNKFSGQFEYIPKHRLAAEVPLLLHEGDLVIGLGAGDINTVLDEIFREYQKSGIKA